MNKNFYKIGSDLKIKRIDQQKIKPEKFSNKILLAKSVNIGYYLITPILFGVFFGYWLEKIFAIKLLFFLFFSFGIIGSFYNLWKIVKETK